MLHTPTILQKPWGSEEVWATTHHTIGKILTINGGHRLSRKYHRVKNHTIRILEGTLLLEVGPLEEGGTVETITLTSGQAYHLPSQTIHRFAAGPSGVRLVEVSNAGAPDSVRLEDDYRRITDIPSRGYHSEK